MKLKRDVKTKDEDGKLIVLVPLGGEDDLTAEIEAEDYAFLIHSGISGNWFSTSNGYVAISSGLVRPVVAIVARDLLGAQLGERVVYKDGSSLNLRRANLEKVKSRLNAKVNKKEQKENYTNV